MPCCPPVSVAKVMVEPAIGTITPGFFSVPGGDQIDLRRRSAGSTHFAVIASNDAYTASDVRSLAYQLNKKQGPRFSPKPCVLHGAVRLLPVCLLAVVC